MKSSSPTKPIYGGIIAAAVAPRPAKPEEYDRLTRKDFWNDPDRWEGIDDPRKTMIWEVRRPDRIDLTTVKPAGGQFALNSAEHQSLLVQQAKMQAEMQYAQYQGLLQSTSLMNMGQASRSMFWPIF